MAATLVFAGVKQDNAARCVVAYADEGAAAGSPSGSSPSSSSYCPCTRPIAGSLSATSTRAARGAALRSSQRGCRQTTSPDFGYAPYTHLELDLLACRVLLDERHTQPCCSLLHDRGPQCVAVPTSSCAPQCRSVRDARTAVRGAGRSLLKRITTIPVPPQSQPAGWDCSPSPSTLAQDWTTVPVRDGDCVYLGSGLHRSWGGGMNRTAPGALPPPHGRTARERK